MPSRSPRRSHAERHAELLDAALAEFSIHGLEATTAAVAARAGVSQPYVFRFFPTKAAMIRAAVDRCFERSRAAFAEVSQRVRPGAHPEARLTAMGNAYLELLREPTLLGAQLQAYAAMRDAGVRAVVRRRFRQMLADLERLSGAPRPIVEMFLAHGMFVTIAAGAGVRDVALRPAWADHLPQLTALFTTPRR